MGEPPRVRVNVDVLIVLASISSLKTALTFVLTSTVSLYGGGNTVETGGGGAELEEEQSQPG
jgi:hypothetical protein